MRTSFKTKIVFAGALLAGITSGTLSIQSEVQHHSNRTLLTTSVGVQDAQAKKCKRSKPGAIFFCHNGEAKDESACARYNTQICDVKFTGCEWIEAGYWTGYMCVSDPSKPPLTVSEN